MEVYASGGGPNGGSSIQCDAGLCNGACSLLVEGRTRSTAAGGLKAKELGWTQAEGPTGGYLRGGYP